MVPIHACSLNIATAFLRSLSRGGFVTASGAWVRIQNPSHPPLEYKGVPFMAIKNLRDLWLDELKDLYNAEKQIIAALPKMAKAASEDDLRQAFEEHLEQTHGHVDRLEEIFKSIDEPVRGKKCKGMEGIIGEGKEMLEEDLPETVCDAALIAAAQR